MTATRVKVPALEMIAVINDFYVGAHRVQYDVAYFHNGDRETA